jgi:hypothetical protein
MRSLFDSPTWDLARLVVALDRRPGRRWDLSSRRRHRHAAARLQVRARRKVRSPFGALEVVRCGHRRRRNRWRRRSVPDRGGALGTVAGGGSESRYAETAAWSTVVVVDAGSAVEVVASTTSAVVGVVSAVPEPEQPLRMATPIITIATPVPQAVVRLTNPPPRLFRTQGGRDTTQRDGQEQTPGPTATADLSMSGTIHQRHTSTVEQQGRS